jgi:hypothetical protein
MISVQVPVQLPCNSRATPVQLPRNSRATRGRGHPPYTPRQAARLHACALLRLATGLPVLAPTDDHRR